MRGFYYSGQANRGVLQKRSLGELYLIDAEGKTHAHGDAFGTVEIPAGKLLSLYYSFDPAYGCSLLHDINPHALHSISFLGSEIFGH